MNGGFGDQGNKYLYLSVLVWGTGNAERRDSSVQSGRVTENRICLLWLPYSGGRCSVCQARASLPEQLRCQAAAVHTSLEAYALQFWDQALQICVENLGLTMHEACTVGQGQASIAAWEGGAGYSEEGDPIHMAQAMAFVLSKRLCPSMACGQKAQKTARTT